MNYSTVSLLPLIKEVHCMLLAKLYEQVLVSRFENTFWE